MLAKYSSDDLIKDLVINELCSNMVQNWFINNDDKSKGRRIPFPTTVTEEMKETLNEENPIATTLENKLI